MLGHSKYQGIEQSHHWFKCFGNFDGGVDFGYWWVTPSMFAIW